MDILLGALVAMVLIVMVLRRISRPTVDRLEGEPAIMRNVEALNEAAETYNLTNLEARVMESAFNRDRVARNRPSANDWHNEPRTDFDRLHMSLHTSHTDNLRALAQALDILKEVATLRGETIDSILDRLDYLESLLPPDLSPDA